MKISHEVPLCLLKESWSFNDYDYALAHLMQPYPEYFQFFKDSLSAGREVILDNSVFELGEPFAPEPYKKLIERLQPTYAIIPDRFTDSKFTIRNVMEWAPFIHSIGVKSIGVIQGATLEELRYCYEAISSYVDKIAISFAQPLFAELYPLENKDFARMYGRQYLINYLARTGVLDTKKEHHLLGISLPQEVAFYKKAEYSFITSVDTSSPIVHGLRDIRFNDNGLQAKDPTKLDDLFAVTEVEDVLLRWETIMHNVHTFKKLLSCG